jgi:hypothetical protein
LISFEANYSPNISRMKNNLIFSFLLCLLTTSLFSQSNIQQTLSVNSDGAASAASAQLDVSATNKGVLVPRLTTAQRTAIASPANGLLVYDSNLAGFWFYNGAAWQGIGSGMVGTPSLIADTDGNTKVQVEKNPNEDIIRFDLGGTENMVLRKNAGGAARLELPNPQNNTFVGTFAGSSNTTGLFNTASGAGAMQSNATGNFNAAHGMGALSNNTGGEHNSALGAQALQSNTTGFGNTTVGRLAEVNNASLFSATALGSLALVNANQKVVIGDNNANMVIGGYANWSNLSDGRFKKNIREDVPGLAFIEKLRPVTYIDLDKLQHHITAQMPDSIAQQHYPTAEGIAAAKNHILTGFVAQEVEAVARQIGYAFDGVNVPKNPTDNYSIAYSQFVPSLVKAV